ncbi:MAG: ATPase, T2SS/T4P/T4SS family [Deltaproteobacteria bacterium]|nr:ATPase, T2SS/T4P/T4SS family [Deltaproteobacteria bacterium]
MIPSDAFRESLALFFEPIAPFLADGDVSEIMINGCEEIWVERRGVLSLTDAAFPSREALDAALTNVAQFEGRPFDAAHPILEAHLPDGSRLEAVIPPLAAGGPAVAIRRFSRAALTTEQLLKGGSLSPDAAGFLARVVAARKNILVSGGTGSGKTSLLAALSRFVPDGERIVVIEDTRELKLQKRHVVYLTARAADERGRGQVAIRDLLRATLRLRPDRIVVGEVRGAEAIDLVQAMTTGHGGSMTTVHASSPVGALRRLETMALMDDTGLPLKALRAQIASAVDLVVQVARVSSGHRLVTAVGHVRGLTPQGDYAVCDLFSRGRGGPLERARRADKAKGAQA